MDEHFIVSTKMDCEAIGEWAKRNPASALQFKALIVDALSGLLDATDAMRDHEDAMRRAA